MRPWGPCHWLALLCLASAACGEDVPIPPRSLSSPAGVVSVQACAAEVDGRNVQVEPSRCEEGGDLTGDLFTVGLVANRQRESLMLVRFTSGSDPRLVDINVGEPGITGIPVCRGPRQVETTQDGVLALVRCDIDRALSIVAVPLRREVLRIERPLIESDLAGAPDAPLFALARPRARAVSIERLTYQCEGQTDTYFEGCEPQVSLVEELLVETDGAPAHVTMGSQGRLYVAYQDRNHLSVFDLEGVESDCESPPCEIARIGLVAECSDGVDNDGDGAVDQEDAQCFAADNTESADSPRGILTACTDGEDNDGDGMLDHDDIDCLSPRDDNERGGVLPPECEDGRDNDGDGSTDGDDPECETGGLLEAGPGAPPEEGVPVCANGADDDGDGFADRADPGCTDRDDDSESGPLPVCSDGADNDGDGLADAADPDCYGAAGRSERALLLDGFGPLSLQDNEQYLSVVDSARHQVLVIDTLDFTLLDAGVEDFLHPSLGVQVTSSGVIAAPAGYQLASESQSDESTSGIEQDILVAPSSDGVATVVNIALTHYVEENGERTEGFDRPVRPRDFDSLQALVQNLECEIPDDFRDAIREARGTDVATRVLCEDEELPRLVSLDQGDEASASEDVVRLIEEQRSTLEDGELVEETVPFDYRLRDETWTLTYEGVLPATVETDAVVDEEVEGLLLSTGTDFCGQGIEPGDHLILSSASPLLDVPEGEACAAFLTEDVVLEYEVEFVRADAIYLALVEGDEEGDEGDNLVDQLPDRTCFAEGVQFEVRATETWVVSGSVTGMVHDQTSLSEQCVRRTGDPTRTGRLTEGEDFEHVFFTIRLEAGTVQHTRDTVISFFIQNNFATTVVNIGPSPVDVDLARTTTGRMLSISDGGSNTLFMFDADTLSAVVNLF